MPNTEAEERPGAGRRGLIEIGEFVPAESHAFPTATRLPRTGLYGALLAATVSIGFHFALVATIVALDAGVPTHAPPPAAMQWLTEVDLPGDSTAGTQWAAAALLPEPALSPIHVLRVDQLSLPSMATDERSEAHGTDIYGLYVRQIDARIERAWLRPRTPIGASLFSCRVEIIQDIAGNVLNWTLQECNGDARWQQSLVSAIRSSSPLPAPPDPNLNRRKVQLTFQSAAYDPHGRSELYEADLRR